MNDALIMIPGYALVGMASPGIPPKSTSGLWIEVDIGDDSNWSYVAEQSAYVEYKVKKNAS